MTPDELFLRIYEGLSTGAPPSELDALVQQLRAAEPESHRWALAASELAFRARRIDDGLRALEPFGLPETELQRAKGLALGGDFERALTTALEAVKREPNLTQGPSFVRALAHRVGGLARVAAALEAIAASPSSWRAQVLLGQQRFLDGDRATAGRWWSEALERASGSAEAADAIREVAKDEAEAIVPSLAKPRHGPAVVLPGPLWLEGLEERPLPPPEPGHSVVVWAFSDDGGGPPGEAQLALSLPLYLAERLRLFTSADAVTVVPVDFERGFARVRTPWSLAEAKAFGPRLPRLWMTGHLGSDITGQRSLELKAVDAHSGKDVLTQRLRLTGDWLAQLPKAAVDGAVKAGLVTRRSPPAGLAPERADDTWLSLLARLCEVVLAARGALAPRDDDAWVQLLGEVIERDANLEAPRLLARAALAAVRRTRFPMSPPWQALARKLK